MSRKVNNNMLYIHINTCNISFSTCFIYLYKQPEVEPVGGEISELGSFKQEAPNVMKGPFRQQYRFTAWCFKD